MTEHIWRSLLYIPAHVEKFVLKASASGADVVILDLEDSVPAGNKQMARDMIQSSAVKLHDAGIEVAVRINQNPTVAQMDLEASISKHVSAIIMPKVEKPSQITTIIEQVTKIEGAINLQPYHTNFIALIESPAGLLAAAEIAKASPRLKALNLGTEDFAMEMGMIPEWTSLLFPSQQIIIACRAAGITPLGYAGSITQYSDINAFSEIVQKSARLGFEGGFAIHPAQIQALNDAFKPSAEDIEKSRFIVNALEDAEKKGLGAISVEGKMVDAPVAQHARKILARAKLIANRLR